SVQYVPDLQLSNANRVGMMMLLAIDVELNAVFQSEAESETYLAIRRDRSRHKRLDFTQSFWQTRCRWLWSGHLNRSKQLRFPVSLERSSIEGQGLDTKRFPLGEGTDN